MKKLLLDFGPLALFFVGYRSGDLMLATALLVGATMLSLAYTYLTEKKIHNAPLVSGILVAVFGGLTIALNDELFIKMKPTIVNTLFAVTLIGGAMIWKKGLLKFVFEMAFTLTDHAWRILSLRWGIFFLFLAVLNEVIWRNFSTDFWVDFKVFGMMSCTIAFTLTQIPFIQKHTVDEQQ